MAEQDVQAPHGPALQSTSWERLKTVDESFYTFFTFEAGCYVSKHIDENLPACLKCDLMRNAVMPPTTKSRTTRVAMRLSVVN